ncbi:hypothetical protein INT45_011784 [Circinella minor]|uniref:Tyr recombinase domain-containing protein n=1 Tax=Circinella minor TaxID=1195481 RepID=A0A8H7SBA2_9FUNG|nr:hypothetical protein INT45_011784 [Circinella minor]
MNNEQPSNPTMADLITSLQQLSARIDQMESQNTPSALPMDTHDNPPATALDADDDYLTEQAPTTLLQPYPELMAALPGMEKDFFRNPMDDDTRCSFLHECPRNTGRQYTAPPVNRGLGLSTKTQQFDRHLRLVQYRLSGITRPIDLFVHDTIRTQQVDVTTALRFANSIHMLLSDAASFITNIRSEIVCQDTGLSSELITAPNQLHNRPLLDPGHVLEQTKLNQAFRNMSRRTKTTRRQNSGQNKDRSYNNTSDHHRNTTTRSDDTSYDQRLGFSSETWKKQQSKKKQPTKQQLLEQPVGGRLYFFSSSWFSLSSSPWIHRVIKDGFSIPFHTAPPTFRHPFSNNQQQHQSTIVSPSTSQIIDNEISTLLKKNAIEKATSASGFLSTLFMIPKKTGDLRPVLNLRPLNQYIPKRPFKIENNDTCLSNDTASRLGNEHRSPRRIFTHPCSQTLSTLPPFFLERSSVSVPDTLLWDVPVSNGIHQNSQTSSALGTTPRNTNIQLPRRSSGSSKIPRTSSSPYTKGIIKTFFSGFFGQRIKISFISIPIYRSPWFSSQYQEHDIINSTQEITRSSARGTKTLALPYNNHTSPVLVHREGSGNYIGSVTCSTIHPSTYCLAQSSASQGSRLECEDQHLNSCSEGVAVVDNTSTGMEWPELYTNQSSDRSIHRLIGHGMGHCFQPHSTIRHMDHNRTNSTYQLQRTTHNTACNTASSTSGQSDQNFLRQYHHHCLCQPFRGNEITTLDATCNQHMERMPRNQHANSTNVCDITIQSGRPTIASTSTSVGMECQPTLLQPIGQAMGSTSLGLLRHSPEQQTTTVYDMATGSTSNSFERSSSTLASVETNICMSSLESSTTYNTENTTGKDSSNVNNTMLAQRDMVSDFETAQHQQSDTSSTFSNSSRTRSRSASPTEESTLAFDRMEHKRRRLMTIGIDEDASNILLNPARNQQRTQQYQPIQRRYINWAQQHQIDPFTPNPVHLINFLAFGRVHHNWATSTCANYRSAILDLYHDTSAFHNNNTYHEFFTALNEQTIRSFDKPQYDITPVIQHIITLGNNATMRPIDLTRKLCFLLAITGFLRPSDIERIDDNKTSITSRGLRLIIAVPKEKRRRQPIEKVITIKPHSNQLLCPVQAYQDYKVRFCQVPCRRSYPIPKGPRAFVYRLIRAVHRHDAPIGAERISNHIKVLLDLIPRPPGTTRPKARALGSTAAVEAGASLEDVLVHGSWLSSSIFDTFYRLSRETVTDFTHLALPSTSVSLPLDPQSTSVQAEE